MFNKRHLQDIIKGPAHVLYHVVLIALSASVALSLPYTADFIAEKFLVFWALIGNEKVFLVSVEIALAITLVLSFNYVGRSWKDRKCSNLAQRAGLVFISSSKGFLSRRRSRKLKESKGMARDIMVIGSTGFRTFVDEMSIGIEN